MAGDWFGSLRKYAALRQAATRAAHAPAQPEPGGRPMLVYAGSQPQVRDVADIYPWREWPEQALKLLQNK